MGKKKKKKEKKITDSMTKEESDTYKKVVDVINKSTTTSLIPANKSVKLATKLKHAKDCPCSDCEKESGSLLPENGTLDHGTHCVCYKCKKDTGFNGKSTTTYQSPTYKPCHDGNVFVFRYQGISVYGGGNMKDSEPNKVDLVLDLDRNVRSVSWENDLPEDWECRNRASSKTKILDLFIKDMHAPEHIDASFWKLFWSDLRKEAHKNGGKLSILVMCQGGHGRTGVVLTSLIMASAYNDVGIPKDMHVVTWLRENYCDKAVESARQCDYLTRLWNMRFIEGTKGTSTSFTKGAITTKHGNNIDPDDDDDGHSEVPGPDTKCITCSTKRTQINRILFSSDLKAFECDTCFGIRADKLEQEEDTQEGEELEGIPINDMTDKQYKQWVTSHL